MKKDSLQLSPRPPQHPDDPLHAVTLETILKELVAQYGWEKLGQKVPLRCFTNNPTLTSSLKFLRRTPWARDKVEALYLWSRMKGMADAEP
jgi:uncharacterized protein (DUF2132 family)